MGGTIGCSCDIMEVTNTNFCGGEEPDGDMTDSDISSSEEPEGEETDYATDDFDEPTPEKNKVPWMYKPPSNDNLNENNNNVILNDDIKKQEINFNITQINDINEMTDMNDIEVSDVESLSNDHIDHHEALYDLEFPVQPIEQILRSGCSSTSISSMDLPIPAESQLEIERKTQKLRNIRNSLLLKQAFDGTEATGNDNQSLHDHYKQYQQHLNIDKVLNNEYHIEDMYGQDSDSNVADGNNSDEQSSSNDDENEGYEFQNAVQFKYRYDPKTNSYIPYIPKDQENIEPKKEKPLKRQSQSQSQPQHHAQYEYQQYEQQHQGHPSNEELSYDDKQYLKKYSLKSSKSRSFNRSSSQSESEAEIVETGQNVSRPWLNKQREPKKHKKKPHKYYPKRDEKEKEKPYIQHSTNKSSSSAASTIEISLNNLNAYELFDAVDDEKKTNPTNDVKSTNKENSQSPPPHPSNMVPRRKSDNLVVPIIVPTPPGSGSYEFTMEELLNNDNDDDAEYPAVYPLAPSASNEPVSPSQKELMDAQHTFIQTVAKELMLLSEPKQDELLLKKLNVNQTDDLDINHVNEHKSTNHDNKTDNKSTEGMNITINDDDLDDNGEEDDVYDYKHDDDMNELTENLSPSYGKYTITHNYSITNKYSNKNSAHTPNSRHDSQLSISMSVSISNSSPINENM